MASPLSPVTDAANVTMIAATTGPFPPTSYALVPASWSNGGSVVPELDVDLDAAGAASVTSVKLYGMVRRLGAISDDVIESVDTTANTATLTAHGLLTGDGPIQLTTSGALPSGLAVLTDYWIIRSTADAVKFAASLALALAGTAIDLGAGASGTNTIVDTASTMVVRWSQRGAIEASLVLASIRESLSVRAQHNARVIAYAVTWTGTAASAITATISPVMEP